MKTRNGMRFIKGATYVVMSTLWGFSAALQAETVRMMHVEAESEQSTLWDTFIEEFEAKNPDINVESVYLENEAFKAKLPTLLQSDSRPNLFYSWGGGNFAVRAEEGLLDDISAHSDSFKEIVSEGGIAAFTHEGKTYGLPYNLGQVGFWYNKALFAKAGVSADDIKTWGDLLETVTKLKAAGITPIALGAGDKWPAHFYWTYLAMRIGGEEVFNTALSGDIDWNNPDYIKAGELFEELVALDPFLPGFAATGFTDASGKFGDHLAAMHLMGDFDKNVQRDNSQNKKGVTDEDLGFFNFPAVEGGKGNSGDTLGAVNGFAFSKGGATEGALKWMAYFLAKPQQERLAAASIIVPAAKGASEVMADPYLKQMANNIADAKWHQVYWDQALGADVGGVINDFSAEIASGDISPDDAVKQLQEAWEFR